MLLCRVIPCLLLHNEGLVKTVRFRSPGYVGDPINAVRIFNEKEVDELVLVDIDATRHGREPNYRLIEDIASECFMPLCYGGGVRTLEQMGRLFGLGVEKVSVSAAAIETPDLVGEAAARFGSQSVIVTLDVKRSPLWKRYEVVTYNATRKHRLDPVAAAVTAARAGAGELLVNAVDRDGTMAGYDEPLVKAIADAVDVPVVALGGAGSLDDIRSVIRNAGASAAAAGSLFVYKGIHKAVLINYPSQAELQALLSDVGGAAAPAPVA